jgi:ABC-type branched-subunit amino acid transport system substrate-binding protein
VRLLLSASVATLVIVIAGIALPAQGPAEIVLGMSAALSGPSAALGHGMRRGVEAYLHRVNESGGVGGRKLRLVALDDSYQVDPVKDNLDRLIDRDHVLAFIGNVGTQGAGVAVPIANERRVLLFGAFSGAELLRKTPPDRYVINLRASYAEETDVMVRGLLKRGIKPQQIAFFTQKDAYGDSGYAGAVRALRELGFDDAASLAHGRYARGTLDVEDGVLAMMQAKVQPRAVIMVGAYGACARFIRLARQLLPRAVFLNVSFVGSAALNAALGADGDGVVITQVVPHYDSALPGTVEYRQALAKYSPGEAPDFVSLEGYLDAKALVEGLRHAGQNVTREGIIDALEKGGPIDLGIGAPLHYSHEDHQGSHRVWLSTLKAQKIVPLEW